MMQENYKIIKEIIKNNKKISILQNNDGKYLFRKLINNKSNDDMLSLENEINCLKILNDTGIVPKIIECNLDIETPYIITEYINFKRLDKYNFSSLDEKLKCFISILDAINIIHINKIIHCDLKPQQIFIDSNFNVKIIDFGISSINDKEILSNYGSINYCSPEKINKQRITTYSDIFSLGIIFYKLITGELPFKRDCHNLKKSIDLSKIKKIKVEELNKIFYKTINENYSFRYKNVNQFKTDLIKILDKRRNNVNEKFKKYLPLGSVVLMNGGRKRVMITGYAVKAAETGDRLWDYIGCLWPEGMIAPDKNLLFDHKDIYQIYAIGYSDDEQKRFMSVLDKATELNEQKENKLGEQEIIEPNAMLQNQNTEE